MDRTITSKKIIALALTTALATTGLSGCASKGGPRADMSASQAERALADGKTDKAVSAAELAVSGDPRNASYRAMLGNAYLEAGRFQSAVTSYDDAMSLGDQSPRTALSLALAKIALGRNAEAAAVLDDWRDVIAPADLGLAYSLAGDAHRGVLILTDTLRGGENTAKVRQNLAYSYALDGRWREARLMASQDVPGDQIDQRIGEWAVAAHPEAFQQRVAALLAVPAGVTDPGQPTALALTNTPDAEQLAAEATALAPRVAVAADGELPAEDISSETESSEPTMALARYEAPVTSPPESFEAAFATSAPKGATPVSMIADAIRFVREPVVQKLPSRYGIAPSPAASPVRGIASGSHLVQLGSFASEQGARRAWGMYTKRHPGLSGHELKITEAKVNGRNYWRVSATGFDKSGARSMCADVKNSSNEGCIAYSASSPLPGEIS